MKTTPSTLLVLAACALPLLAQQPAAPLQQDAPPAEAVPKATPGWLEGLLYNPAERTREGAEALDAGAPAAASEALDAAMRLDPSSEKARYNAGTARLLASSEEAAPLLESAARSSDAALAARAFYNLGNSRLEGEDYQGAIDAYKDSLRRDPASADAKFNLELALRRLQEQQQNQQNQQNQDQQNQDQQNQDQQQGRQDQQDQQQQQGDQKKDGQEQQEKQQEQQGQGEQKEQQEQQQQQQQPPKQGQGEQGPLPQFRDLPDMDAQQAAAILEAIENLERSQRRDDAKKALKANAGGKKDW